MARNTGRKPRIERQTFLNEVYELLEIGATENVIKRYMNIKHDTWERWKETGVQDYEGGRNTPYSRFYRLLERGGAQQTVTALKDLRKQSKEGIWQASKILLERNPEYREGTASQVNITINDMRQIVNMYGLQRVREVLEAGDSATLETMIQKALPG